MVNNTQFQNFEIFLDLYFLDSPKYNDLGVENLRGCISQQYIHLGFLSQFLET